MQLGASTAIVDNDFVNHVVESRLGEERIVQLLCLILNELGLQAVVHPLVYEKEMMLDNKLTIRLFSEKILNKAEFSDVFSKGEAARAYYTFLVKEFYFSLTGKQFPVEDDRVLCYWVRRTSLGEIHSLAMCLVCECGIFLSDDGDSKKLMDFIKRKALGAVTVYSRGELIDKHNRWNAKLS